jgi:hypothetical protein
LHEQRRAGHFETVCYHPLFLFNHHGDCLAAKLRARNNTRGTAEQWIKEAKQAAHWTRLSCHRFRANEVQLSLIPLRGCGDS